MQDYIKIKGARVNNLKNIDLDIPINKLTCFLGPSGSGKTSLAFHTLYSESKRRFINSFPTSMKFFAERPAPVDVDTIHPVLPVFGLPQINPVVGTRSNVADVMHMTGLFQNYFGNYSKKLCPDHLVEFEAQSLSQYIDRLLPKEEKDGVYHLFIEKDEFLEKMINTPFPSRTLKSKRTKTVVEFDKDHELWEVLRFKYDKLNTLDKKYKDIEKLNLKLYLFSSTTKKIKPLNFIKDKDFFCPVNDCQQSSREMKKGIMSFSPYNALGACDTCNGFGETLEYDEKKLFDEEKSVNDGGVLLLNYKRFDGQLDELLYAMGKKKISKTKPIKDLPQKFRDLVYEGFDDYYGFNAYFRYLERKKYKMNVRIFVRNLQKGVLCPDCLGTRLGEHVNNYYIYKDSNINIKNFLGMRLEDLRQFVIENKPHLIFKTTDGKKAYTKIINVLTTACEIGLGHLSLLRKSKTLSAGEYQRLLLLKYLAYDGTGALFVFDEPSLGLSQNEMGALHGGFRKLIANGNTVLLIDHNEYLQKQSDYLVEIGPEAGHLGGELIFQGEVKKYKFDKNKLELKTLKLSKKSYINLKKPEIFERTFQDIKVIQNGVNCVVGASGTGKTSCMINILADALKYQISGEHLNLPRGTFKSLKVDEKIDDVIIVDANLNRYTSRSTVGSMTGFFPVFRKHYARTSMAKAMGLVEGHLSYNSELGQCPKCEGKGHTVVEMQFLEDIILKCEDCDGKKLKPQYASLTDGKFTVHEAYSKPLSQVVRNIKLTPKFSRIYEYMKLLNLDYLSLDRKITSLSGGEKQRIYLLSKLQKELSNSILFFENISFGLSKKELQSLCEFLQNLSVKNNTIVIIDQNPAFLKIANNTIKFD